MAGRLGGVALAVLVLLGVFFVAWRFFSPSFFYGVVAMAVACTPMTESQGNNLDPELVKGIKPGLHNRAQVSRILGTPSSTATFDRNIWYYISKRTERLAFFEPEIVDQNVVVVIFNDDGMVSEVKRVNGVDAREVDLVARVTPTRGKELGLMGQLFKTLLRGAGSALGDPGESEDEGFTRY